MKTTRRQRFDIANAAALRVLRARPIYDAPTWRPGDTTRCVCPACDPDDEPGGDDLESFWREQTPEEREAISAAYVKAYGDRPYGDQSHAMSEP